MYQPIVVPVPYDRICMDGNHNVLVWRNNKTFSVASSITGKVIRTFDLPYRGIMKDNWIRCFDLSSDAKYVVAGTFNNNIMKFSVDSSNLVQKFEGLTDNPESVKISPNDKYLASSAGGLTLLWDFCSGVCLQTITTELCRDFSFTGGDLSFTPDNQFIFVRGRLGLLSTVRHLMNEGIEDIPDTPMLQYCIETNSQKLLPDSYCLSNSAYPNILLLSHKAKFGASAMVTALDAVTTKELYHLNFPVSIKYQSFVVKSLTADPKGFGICCVSYRWAEGNTKDPMKLATYIWDIRTGTILHTLEDVSYVDISVDFQLITVRVAEGMEVWRFSEWLKLHQIESFITCDEKQLSEEKNQESQLWICRRFLDVIEDPEKFSFPLLGKMFDRVKDISEFKFPYTLANIELAQNLASKTAINALIYPVLERLTESCVHGSIYIAQFKLLVDSVLEKGLITQGQLYKLNSDAEDNKTFSDERFKQLERNVEALKKEVDINRKNIENVSNSLNQLKMSLNQQRKRNMYFSVAKVALAFVGAAAIDFFSSIYDLSDLKEIGAAILKIKPEKMGSLLAKGVTSIHENMDVPAAALIKQAGYDPDEFVNVWVSTFVTLETPTSQTNFVSIVNVQAPVFVSNNENPPERNPVVSTYTDDEDDSDDPFPIHTAIRQNLGDEIIDELLKMKIDINEKDTAGKSPVRLAAELGNISKVHYLFAQGATGNKLKCIQLAKANQQ